MTELHNLFEESQQVREEADCLFDKESVYAAVKKMADEMTVELAETNPVVLAIMNGGLIPMGLLLPELDFPMQIDYLHATRYRGKTRGGELHWLVTPKIDLKDRHVILIDDIHDEGVTLYEITRHCYEIGAKKVHTAVLVNKIHDRKSGTHADFSALDVPDRYVFGFGMDYKGMLRNVPGIYAVKGL